MANSASSFSDDKEKYVEGTHTSQDVNEVKIKEEQPESYYVQKYGRFGPVLQRLFASGVEARGVERVPEDQRTTKNMWNKYAFPLCSL